MLFFDVETTALIENEALPLALQPRIIEIGLVQRSLELDAPPVRTFSTLVNPGVPLPAVITKITGLTDAELLRAPSFAEVLPHLIPYFLGETELIAHNAGFDHAMLVFELRRLGKEYRFPYPPRITDSKTRFTGKLQEWGRRVKGEAFAQTHRALDDALLLMECWFSDVRDEE